MKQETLEAGQQQVQRGAAINGTGDEEGTKSHPITILDTDEPEGGNGGQVRGRSRSTEVGSRDVEWWGLGAASYHLMRAS